jgi:hypothetical protein
MMSPIKESFSAEKLAIEESSAKPDVKNTEAAD